MKDVNDNAPKFKRLLNVEVPESSAVGSIVTRVVAEDPDEAGPGQVQYSLEGPGSEYFALDAVSGNVLLLRTLDREQVIW